MTISLILECYKVWPKNIYCALLFKKMNKRNQTEKRNHFAKETTKYCNMYVQAV